MAEIIWSEPALSDLDAIADCIALDKPDAASRLVERVVRHVELLTRHPELGPTIPELRPISLYRQIVEAPCRVFYRYDKVNRRIFVLGVMRGEKLFQEYLLLERDESTRL
jgi:toxin ParE1/3/4